MHRRRFRNRELDQRIVAPDVQEIGLREWSPLDRAVEAGRRAATQELETGGAERLRAALEAPL